MTECEKAFEKYCHDVNCFIEWEDWHACWLAAMFHVEDICDKMIDKWNDYGETTDYHYSQGAEEALEELKQAIEEDE